MNKDELNRLVSKYKLGETTLKEEELLFSHHKQRDPTLDAWSSFIKKNKIKIPDDLNDSLWENFEPQKSKHRRIWRSTMTAAASVILVIALIIGFQKQDKQTYAQKEALLNEALSMFPFEENTTTAQNIIYENEMIVLYTTSK